MATRKKAPTRYVDLESVEALEVLIEDAKAIASVCENERDRISALALVARLLEQRDKAREGVRRGSPLVKPELRAVPNR